MQYRFKTDRPPRSTAVSKRGHERGIALLIVLTLLGFVALLLVSIGLLTRVETRVLSNSYALARARGNAQVGLDLAVAHLQRVAGPDQRLTARAELVTTGALNQPYLTGVWTSDGVNPVLTTWLVSGNHAGDLLAIGPNNVPLPSAAAGPNEVFLVDRGTVGTDAQRVKLVKEPIRVSARTLPGATNASAADVTVGSFAYWMGDQGIKASAALGDLTDQITYDNRAPLVVSPNAPAGGDDWSSDSRKRERLRQMALPRQRTEKLFVGFDPDLSTGLPLSVKARLSRVITYAQLPMVDSTLTLASLKSQFHHASVVSRAVLVDHSVPAGKLREDLSDTADVPDLPVQMYLRERPASVSGLVAQHAAFASTISTATRSLSTVTFSKGPVLTECSVRFQFYRNAADQHLRLRYEIQAELWNPYSTALQTAAAELRLRITGLPAVTVTAGLTTATIDLSVNVVEASVAAPTTWLGGQILVLKGGSILSSSGTAADADTVPLVVLSSDPLPGGVVANLPSVGANDSLKAELRLNADRLASYEPSIAFNSTTVVNASADSGVGWVCGYAFDFNDDYREWVDGSRVTARDPRSPRLQGNFFNSSFPYWSMTPSANTGAIRLGGADTFNTGRRIPLVELPRQEVVSVGSLQHMIGPKPALVGNPWGNDANECFDQYFFSTIPRWAGCNPASFPALPNRWIGAAWYERRPAPLGDPFGMNSTTSDELLDRTHAAKHLLISGAFNINSTSVVAWRAVLGGVRFSSWTYGGASEQSTSLDNAVFRFSQTAQEFSTDPHAAVSSADPFQIGVRVLTDTQISTMASYVVSALRTRGRPFPTLASFTNSGILRDAIAAAGINAPLPASAAYTPAWLSQADILNSIAPFITPRSDTFLIRAYGDSQNTSTGEIEGRAWCEAIVQRVPELVDTTGGPMDPAVTPLAPDPADFPFGRRFKIVFFRWLSPEDI